MDDHSTENLEYNLSNDSKSTFINHKNIYFRRNLVSRMKEGKVVKFKVKPYAENDRIAKFSLSGFTKSHEVVKDCAKK